MRSLIVGTAETSRYLLMMKVSQPMLLWLDFFIVQLTGCYDFGCSED